MTDASPRACAAGDSETASVSEAEAQPPAASPTEPLPGLWALIREDVACNGGWNRPGSRAMAVYRLGAWAAGLKTPFVGRVIRRVVKSLHRLVRNSYGIEIYPTATIGRRVVFGHQNGIVIHEYARIGDDCVIRHGVTMGLVRSHTQPWSSDDNAPVLGNRVDVGVGVVVLGGVTIGDDVRIFPNAVVMTDVAAGSTVISPISRVIARP